MQFTILISIFFNIVLISALPQRNVPDVVEDVLDSQNPLSSVAHEIVPVIPDQSQSPSLSD
ncbi:hypothetical protein DFH28DRAFT_1224835 [Melampsora americana]|nr:hypothetical protein DFH28DRAFT_1224835 [Melampsora americana]